MQKLKKNCVILLVITLSLIMISCVSKPKTETVLPVRPQRKELNPPETDDDLEWEKYYNSTIAYYDGLVKDWENWADTVERIVY